MTEPLPPSGAIEGGEHRLPVRVYYEDTDFTGVVYHAGYLRFFERGRSEFLRCAGVSHPELMELPTPVAFAVVRLEIDYKAPARMDDALVVRTTFERPKTLRMIAHQRLTRGDTLLAQARVELVCVSSGRPVRPPAELMRQLGPWLTDAR